MNEKIIKDNYLVVKKFIPKDRAKELALNFRNYSNSNNLLGDPQAPNSSSCYDYIDFLELLAEKTNHVGEILGEKVLPTYSYARIYREGDDLKKHRDRDSCEISLTIHLDGDAEWPICINKPDGETVSVVLEPGDAMIYLGCQAEHWRDPIPCQEYVQVFLHYVRSRGSNQYHYFDKLKSGANQISLKQGSIKSIAQNNKIHENIDCSSMPRNINDFIKVIEGVIPAPLCDAILNEYHDDDIAWNPALIGQGILDHSIRKVDSIRIDDPYTMQKNMKVRQKLVHEMTEVIFWIMNNYKMVAPFINFDSNSGYELLKYSEGCFYKEHTDSFVTSPRHLAVSLHLNDDYEGGEFAFFNKEKKIKAKKGSAVVFPSNFMFPHEILPVTKGTRYSIITWIV